MALKQKGFSLLEVLVAVLITALSMTVVINLHISNLKKVRDQVALNQAQLILSNTIDRLQQNIKNNYSVVPTDLELNKITEYMQSQILDAELKNTHLNIIPENNGWLVQIDWLAHNEKESIQRVECIKVAVNQHCLALWVAP